MTIKRPILDKFHVDLKQVQDSRRWFDDQVKLMAKGKVTPNALLLRDGIDDLRSNIVPGQLHFFYYDPKLKEKLPYYDQFPMVFPYKQVPGGFLGLNLHYLGYQERFALFKALMDIQGIKKLDNNTKLKYQWGTVMAMSNVPGAQACIKHYLVDHVKSRYMKVKPEDWATAMMLPVERFVGASKQRVWADSLRK
jgi:hypothetical protein